MDSEQLDWVKDSPAAITVCDREGIILEMNDQAASSFGDPQGTLIGSNVLDCHPEPARQIFAKMLAEGKPNVYTIEKNGKKKMIFQSPWYLNGEYAGFIEFSFVTPNEIPHLIRT